MIKAKIEAVLFLTDKPMKAAVLAKTLNEDVQVVRQAVLELIHDYETRAGGLEVADDNGYIIQVKDEYSSLINEFAPLDMPVALLRTLSAIAIKQPVQQSEVIKIRGAGAYDHVKELMLRELIVKKDSDEGRSPLLLTTKKFQEYFRLSGDGKSLRTEMRKTGKSEKAVGEGGTNYGNEPLSPDFAEPVMETVSSVRDKASSGAESVARTVGAGHDHEASAPPAETAMSSLSARAVETQAAVTELLAEASIDDLAAVLEEAILEDVPVEAIAEKVAATADDSVMVEEFESIVNETSDLELVSSDANAVENLEELFAGSPDNDLVFRHRDNQASVDESDDENSSDSNQNPPVPEAQ